MHGYFDLKTLQSHCKKCMSETAVQNPKFPPGYVTLLDQTKVRTDASTVCVFEMVWISEVRYLLSNNDINQN